MRISLGLITCALSISTFGCGLELTKEEGDRRTASSVGGVAMPDMAEPAAGDVAATNDLASDPAAAEPSEEPLFDEPTGEQKPAEQSDTIREKAKVGAGKKGRYEGTGAVVTPIKAYFRAQQKLAYEVQLVQALNLYQATNGYYPRTQEEFDTQIIEANGIKLPELPAGHKYVYDPKSHELMVERPAP